MGRLCSNYSALFGEAEDTRYHHGRNDFGTEISTSLLIQVSHFTRLQFPACMFWLLPSTSGYVCSSGFDKTLNLDNTSSWTFLPVRFKCDTKQPALDQ